MSLFALAVVALHEHRSGRPLMAKAAPRILAGSSTRTEPRNLFDTFVRTTTRPARNG